MKKIQIILLILTIYNVNKYEGYAQDPGMLAAKVFIGKCANCTSSTTGTWTPGSTIRWRIGVTNINSNINTYGLIITDQLLPGFTYAGNVKYFFGPVSSPLTPNIPSCCSLSVSVPNQVQVGGQPGDVFSSPSIGSSNLVWKVPILPGQSTGITKYFIIEFDVSVGTVADSKYCNTFTVKGVKIRPNTQPIQRDTINAISNIAQVTISGSTSGSSTAGTTTQRNNPYATGERGNFYPSTTWSYLTDRERSTNVPSPQTNIRFDGIYSTYMNFWNYVTGNVSKWQKFSTGWQWVETVTKKDVNGLTLETSDVLNRHNALLTGYKNKLVVAEANNSYTNEVLFESFEDWNYVPIAAYCDTNYQCVPKSINWDSVFVQDIRESHAGRYAGKLVERERSIQIPTLDSVVNVNADGEPFVGSGYNSRGNPCAGAFKPTTGKKYVLSAWVRDTSDRLATNFASPAIHVETSVFNTSGNIIDGWQRIYGEFTIPTGTPSITIRFINGIGSTWFDDIRIFPYDAKMVTYIYDGNTQKLTFTSDENNYFTKYNYDVSDNLESINKETEKGVLTIKEARSGVVKLP